MHLSHEDYIQQLKNEVVCLAGALLEKNSDYLYAVRRLPALRHEICAEVSDADFNVFVVIDSSTDHLPSAQMRSFCSPDWLAKTDEELKEIGDFYQADLVESCTKLIERFRA